MSKIDKIAVTVLSFLISLFGFAALITGVLSNTVASPKFMIKVLENRHYYDTIYSEYCDSVESLAIPAGVDESVFSSVVTKSEFKEGINKIIISAYSNSDAYAGDSFDSDSVYNKFYNTMTEFFTTVKGVEITDEMTDSLHNVASLCASTCEVYITLPFIDVIGRYATEFNSYFELGTIICAVFATFLIVMLCITKKWREICPYCISIALISSGLMLITAPLITLLSGKIRYIQIELKSLYTFAVGYIEYMLYELIAVGAALIILAVLIIILTDYLKKKVKKDQVT